MKHNFYFTFGQKYAHDPHPTYAHANPNGWVRIVADSYQVARRHAFELFGEHFSMQYMDANWKPEYFPAGEIECIEI